MSGSFHIKYSPVATGRVPRSAPMVRVLRDWRSAPKAGRSQVFQMMDMPSAACHAMTPVRPM